METWVECRRPQNNSGALEQNSDAALEVVETYLKKKKSLQKPPKYKIKCQPVLEDTTAN